MCHPTLHASACIRAGAYGTSTNSWAQRHLLSLAPSSEHCSAYCTVCAATDGEADGQDKGDEEKGQAKGNRKGENGDAGSRGLLQAPGQQMRARNPGQDVDGYTHTYPAQQYQVTHYVADHEAQPVAYRTDESLVRTPSINMDWQTLRVPR